MIGNLVLGRAYQPERLLHEIGTRLTDARLNIEGVHLFTFNQIDASVATCYASHRNGWQECPHPMTISRSA